MPSDPFCKEVSLTEVKTGALHLESSYQHGVKTLKYLCVGFLKENWISLFSLCPFCIWGALVFHSDPLKFCHVFKPNHVILNLTGSEN